MLPLLTKAQKFVTISGTVTDVDDNEPLPSAIVSFIGNNSRSTFADNDGHYTLRIVAGEKYQLKVTYVGYQPYAKTIIADKDTNINPGLKSRLNLSEVTVTAKEGQGPVTKSIIGRDAMSLLQPSSISDLMELLPGGYSKDPNMGVANIIQLRETGSMNAYGESTSNNKFAISSLGTQFIVDGAPINTDANLQYSPLGDTQSITSGAGAEAARDITNKGVDMRTISTDDIEKVEVIRGIPSVEYGNLTSGIVNIQKIRRAMPLTIRFKADGYSKLVSIGKGLTLGKGKNKILNLDIGWLDSKTDPTDNLENYKRLNGSVRYSQRHRGDFGSWFWNAGFDYTGSFDDSKADPDLNYGRIDEYRSSYNRMALTNTWKMNWTRNILREIEVNTNVSLQLDRLKQTRLVAPQRYGIVPTNWEDGEHEAGAVYAEYLADYLCDGKPFSAYIKAKGILQFNTWKAVEHRVKFGLNWDYSKNFGNGQVYDMYHPLSITGWSSRPRRYKDIPGLQNLSVFVEENFTWNFAGNQIDGMLGVRLNTMPGLDTKFDMSGKVYADPRLNLSWRLPYATIGGKPLKVTLNGGCGITSKNPTLNYLYPDKYYGNFIELAYYDTQNPERDSRFVVMSYVQDPTNYQIRPARNHKWEVRLDLDWNNHTLSVNYFHETMNDGFRYSRIYDTYTYKRYDVTQMSAGTDWTTLPYAEKQVLDGYTQSSNGSKMVKQGIELQYTSARIRPLRTRININGAWFHTTYTNSQPMFEPVTSVIDNQVVSEKYVGLYDWNDGRVNDRLNTNLMLDTQIPEWGFIFTTSVQFMWLVRTKMQWKNGTPVAYLSAEDGALHPFTKESESDIYLQQLVRHYSEAQFDPFTVPMSMIINLKATKQIGKLLKISLFANKILDYLPDFKSNGHVIRRNASPYFGVEANVTL